ncbi:MAG: peptidylprolyl isomerase [Myxococcales bacterium]|nr:peptidylprolyl isomerase [Myxococcales bacterium]
MWFALFGALGALPACSLTSSTDPAQSASGSADPNADPPPADSLIPVEASYAATHVLVSHAGAAKVPSGIQRTPEEARKQAIAVWRRLEAGESMEDLARRFSDGPSAIRGGTIGVYATGTMMPEFEQAVAAVGEGMHTRPFQTAFGWHVARRDAVLEAGARHILITWSGAARSKSGRSKPQALQKIQEIKARLDAGEDFSEVARGVSEDATAPAGGDLGTVAPGQLIPAFEDALFALTPGQRSHVVETPYGFHIIERTR